MKPALTIVLMAATLLSFSPGVALVSAQNRTDEQALREMVREWANAVVHGDVARLEKINDANFKGSAEGISFNNKMLSEALRSKTMEVASWTIDDVKVRMRGNAAEVSGRSTLANAKFMGQDYSGDWEWTDRFVKQRDGSWRAVSSQAKRVKK